MRKNTKDPLRKNALSDKLNHRMMPVCIIPRGGHIKHAIPRLSKPNLILANNVHVRHITGGLSGGLISPLPLLLGKGGLIRIWLLDLVPISKL